MDARQNVLQIFILRIQQDRQSVGATMYPQVTPQFAETEISQSFSLQYPRERILSSQKNSKGFAFVVAVSIRHSPTAKFSADRQP